MSDYYISFQKKFEYEKKNSNLSNYYHDFHKQINNEKLPQSKRTRILLEMNNMKEEMPELSIIDFLCMLDKIVEPEISYWSRSAENYINAVKIWNNYIWNNYVMKRQNGFFLLINTDKTVY